MYIREELVYVKHTGTLIGFGQINDHMLAFERSLEPSVHSCWDNSCWNPRQAHKGLLSKSMSIVPVIPLLKVLLCICEECPLRFFSLKHGER